MVVGLSTVTDGVQSGTAAVSLESDGTGIDSNGTTALASQSVSVTGTVYALAAPDLSATTLNFGAARVGDEVTAQVLTLADGATTDPYQESLGYSLGDLTSAGFTDAGGFDGTVASGETATPTIGLNTSNAGDLTGNTATLFLASSGVGTSGLADTTLPSHTITLNGKVYATAVAQVASSLDFGIVHVGDADAQTLAVTNGAEGVLTDVLTGGVEAVTRTGFSGSGNLGVGVAAGASGGLDFALNTTTSGVFSGLATLSLASHDADLVDEALTVAPIALTGTVDNYATAQVVEVSGTPRLIQAGTAYTLNLGQRGLGAAPVAVELGVENASSGLADLLEGSFTSSGDAALALSGFSVFSSVAAGDIQGGLDVTLNPGNAGVFSQQITLYGTGYNASGYSGALVPEVITITGTVSATLAVATVNNPQPVTLVNQRLGATPLSDALSITNSAVPTAESLDVNIANISGAATASGSFSLLGAGQTDASDISVGVSTASAGAQNGAVTLNEDSDGTGTDNAGTTSIGTAMVTVSGNVYREAAATVALTNSILHVGDPGTDTLTVTNTAAADGYSENLIASLTNASGQISVGSTGPTGEIVAGGTDSSSLSIDFSTAQAGAVTGSVTLAAISDGGLGLSSVDGLGQIALAPQTIVLTAATIDNYATAQIVDGDIKTMVCGASAIWQARRRKPSVGVAASVLPVT